MEIVKKLMIHVDKAEGTTYRDELLTKIIDICSQSNYQYITNFEWSVFLCVNFEIVSSGNRWLSADKAASRWLLAGT